MSNVKKRISILAMSVVVLLFAVLVTSGCTSQTSKTAIKITADNSYNDSSSPAVVVITNDDETVCAKEFLADQLTQEIELDQGSYNAKVVCPLNNDGTYYTCSYSNQIDIEKNNSVVEATFDLNKVEFDKADINQINEIGKSLQEAISKSDGQITQSAMDKYNTNLDVYNKKAEHAQAELAQKQAEEKQSQLAAQIQKLVGNWSAVMPGGGYRGSMNINTDGTGTLTEFSSGSGQYYNNNTPTTVQVITLEAAASSAFGSDSIHFRITTQKGDSEDFIYVARDDKLCPCSSTFTSDTVTSYNMGYCWSRF